MVVVVVGGAGEEGGWMGKVGGRKGRCKGGREEENGREGGREYFVWEEGMWLGGEGRWSSSFLPDTKTVSEKKVHSCFMHLCQD